MIKQKIINLIDLPEKSNIYIVGDLHGRLKMLKLLLHDVGYDSKKDYLFATGDMIDRGRENIETINFFTNHPRRFSVLGNHEDMAANPVMKHVWMSNGGAETYLQMEEEFHDRDWLINMIKELPHIIEVHLRDDHFRIVHAEIPINMNEEAFQEAVDSGDKYLKEYLIWSRKTTAPFQDYEIIQDSESNRWVKNSMEGMMSDIVNGLKANHSVMCFCGHNVLNDPLILPNRISLDLGMNDMALYDYKQKQITRHSEIVDNY